MEDKNNTTNNTINSIESISGISSDNIPVLPENTTKRKYNIQNLQPVRSKKEARERGRNGGIKSGEVRRQKKTMRESIIDLLSQPMTEDIIKQYGLDNIDLKEGATFQDGVMAAVLIGAMNGDTKAAQYLRDTAGEQPTIKTENHTELVTAEDLKTMDNLRKYLTG